MAVGVIQPQQRQSGFDQNLDRIAKGLQIATSLFNIPISVMDRNRQIEKEQKQETLQAEDRKNQAEDRGLQRALTTAQLEEKKASALRAPEEFELTKKAKMAQIALAEAQARRANREANESRVDQTKIFKSLPMQSQKQIDVLSTKSGNIAAIKNEIDSTLEKLQDPAISEDQKVVLGRGLLKTLNSSQGADAIGSEEAKRLGGLLEFKKFNITEPGSMFGRDLGMFIDQVALNSDKLAGALSKNQEAIDRMMSGGVLTVPGAAKFNPKTLSPQGQQANAFSLPAGTENGGYVFKGGDPNDQKNWVKK